MDDFDLEDILNTNVKEELKTNTTNQSQKRPSQNSYQSQNKPIQNQQNQKSQITDDFLDDILNEKLVDESKGKINNTQTFNNTIGITEQNSKKEKCLKCDMTVQKFDNSKWNSDVEYLFFRNMFSNRGELQKKINEEFQCTAYACQCSWESVQELSKAEELKNSKWVCAGH